MIIPHYLNRADKVGVVATAKKVNAENTKAGIEILQSWGLQVHVGEHVFAEHMMFAGTDEQRTADFQKMLDDQDVKAIFLVRGGYGSTRIIDSLDFSRLKEFPKWICGFSDITAIHSHLFSLGIASFHAPMPSFFYALEESALSRFKEMIFGDKPPLAIRSYELNRHGQSKAPLVGGNLSIICHTIGTSSEIQTKGNILFIEDVGEQLYSLDRMMVQLKRGGFLDALAGLIVGQFTEMKDNDPFGKTAYQIISEHVQESNYPVAFNFPIGHSKDNMTVPIGVKCSFIVDSQGAWLELG
jgi:muramoyltetrapeptide carboxypeptidase